MEITRTILQYITYDPAFPRQKLEFIVNESMICSVVRKLMRNNDVHEIEVQCERLLKNEVNLDFPLAVCIAQVCEDQLSTMSIKELVGLAQRYLENPSEIMSQLNAIAFKRVLIRKLAEILYAGNELDVQYISILNTVFEDTKAIMFVLRHITHDKGISFTKDVMVCI